MEFFDRKENVLDVELTPYGKYLLSIGKLDPKYYAFFDDDVLYDGAYAGLNEDQNEIALRIRENTSFLKIQSRRSGVNAYIKRKNGTYSEEKYKPIKNMVTDSIDYYEQSEPDKQIVPLSLGTSEMGNIKAPYWEIQVIKGSFSESETVYSTVSLRNEVQINANDVAYTFKYGNADDIVDSGYSERARRFPDNTYLDIIEDSLILSVEEKNGKFINENFDIEVFEIEEGVGSDGNEVLKPLSFKTKKNPIRNNILLDNEELENEEELPLNPSYVEYFFDVNVDNEIDKRLIEE